MKGNGKLWIFALVREVGFPNKGKDCPVDSGVAVALAREYSGIAFHIGYEDVC